jgi:mutual gliding-motility protein MglA
MPIVNHETREATFKIVYAGTPVSGKTTNLAYIHSRIDPGQRGDLLSLATSTDRTLYFDFMPVTSMLINGYQTKFVLYTVPGQVHYNATRQLVLRGADGIVFVADSHPDRMAENVESAHTLVKNLRDNGLSVGQVPLVLQYNKRDLPGAVPRAHLDYLLNRLPQPLPAFETVASRGVNVFATLNAVSQMILQRFHAGTTFPSAPRHGASSGEPAVAS